MVTVLNAVSLNMLPDDCRGGAISFVRISLNDAKDLLSFDGMESAVGHADTAKLFSQQLDVSIPCNRVPVTLVSGKLYLVGQYKGPRLPEDATQLPEGASIVWYEVKLAA